MSRIIERGRPAAHVPPRRRSQSGFSLLELVLFLVVAGVLTAVAASRFDRGSGIDELGFAERTLSVLRLAQGRALADGCEVRVRMSSSGIEVDQRTALCSGSFNAPVAGTAGGGSTLDSTPRPGVTLSSTPDTFYFDATGAVRAAPGGSIVDVTITVGARQIDVVGATGHVSY